MIALAPYFFPFYAVLVVGAFVAGRLFWNWQPYTVWFHLLLGAAYAFHLLAARVTVWMALGWWVGSTVEVFRGMGRML
jgi:hypothetical protein